jgi:hypothetical protein
MPVGQTNQRAFIAALARGQPLIPSIPDAPPGANSRRRE